MSERWTPVLTCPSNPNMKRNDVNRVQFFFLLLPFDASGFLHVELYFLDKHHRTISTWCQKWSNPVIQLQFWISALRQARIAASHRDSLKAHAAGLACIRQLSMQHHCLPLSKTAWCFRHQVINLMSNIWSLIVSCTYTPFTILCPLSKIEYKLGKTLQHLPSTVVDESPTMFSGKKKERTSSFTRQEQCKRFLRQSLPVCINLWSLCVC